MTILKDKHINLHGEYGLSAEKPKIQPEFILLKMLTRELKENGEKNYR